MEGGRPGRRRAQRGPARHAPLRAGVSRKRWTGYHARSRIEARMRCLKAFGERIAARDPRPTDRRSPHPRRPHEPLQRPRNRRDHPRGMTSPGKGAAMPHARALQQRLSSTPHRARRPRTASGSTGSSTTTSTTSPTPSARSAIATARPTPPSTAGCTPIGRLRRSRRRSGRSDRGGSSIRTSAVSSRPHKAARLQGFPDGHAFVDEESPQSRKALAKWIGDAVPPLLGMSAGMVALAVLLGGRASSPWDVDDDRV